MYIMVKLNHYYFLSEHFEAPYSVNQFVKLMV